MSGPTFPRADPMPMTEVEFHQMFRTARSKWWKGVVVLALFVLGYLLISTALGIVAFAIDAATGRLSASDVTSGRIQLTPAVLLATNLANGLAIPLAMLLQWGFYGQPIRWAHSVVGYLRWRLVARAAVIVVPIWVLLTVVPGLFTPGTGRFGAESVGLLLIVLLTTPIQAAGEEYGARGLISRCAGSWVADPRIALVISTALSAAIFCVAHGAGDPWLILYYFCFGVAMSIIVWRTGGLEVSSLVHTVNNMATFGAAILLGQSLDIDRSAGNGSPEVLLLIFLLSGVTALVWWRAGREGVQRRYRPAQTGLVSALQSSSEPAQLPGEPPR